MRIRAITAALALSVLAAVVAGTSVSAQTASTTIDRHHIPIGDLQTTATPMQGMVDSCQLRFPQAPASNQPWIHDDGTWDLPAKPRVAGSVARKKVKYSVKVRKRTRKIATQNVPHGHRTGVFPVRTSDPAYQYTHNGAHIKRKAMTIRLPRYPHLRENPSCLGTGPIGITSDGVLLFSALDAYGRDAGAHEVFDNCSGHPEGEGTYHRHYVGSCLYSSSKARSLLVGYALDGLGIYMERDSSGRLLTNADLDKCHGRRSRVKWNGKMKRVYHYDVTLEYPYTLGCFRGKPTKLNVVLAGTGSGGAGPG